MTDLTFIDSLIQIIRAICDLCSTGDFATRIESCADVINVQWIKSYHGEA